MRLYLAGPMSGRPLYNAGAFLAARRRLEALGHEVETPFDSNSRVWERHHGRPFDPRTDRCEYGDPLLREMFAEDVATILRSEGIALLDDWRQSKGAPVELAVARLFGMPVLTERGEPVKEETVLEEAQRLIFGDRNADYGHPLDDFTRTGRMWGAILGIADVPAENVGLCMVAVKISREVNHPKRDSLVDIAGYAGCVDMVHSERARRADR